MYHKRQPKHSSKSEFPMVQAMRCKKLASLEHKKVHYEKRLKNHISEYLGCFQFKNKTKQWNSIFTITSNACKFQHNLSNKVAKVTNEESPKNQEKALSQKTFEKSRTQAMYPSKNVLFLLNVSEPAKPDKCRLAVYTSLMPCTLLFIYSRGKGGGLLQGKSLEKFSTTIPRFNITDCQPPWHQNLNQNLS